MKQQEPAEEYIIAGTFPSWMDERGPVEWYILIVRESESVAKRLCVQLNKFSASKGPWDKQGPVFQPVDFYGPEFDSDARIGYRVDIATLAETAEAANRGQERPEGILAHLVAYHKLAKSLLKEILDDEGLDRVNAAHPDPAAVTEQSRAKKEPTAKLRYPKRGRRAASIELLKKELKKRLKAAKDHAFSLKQSRSDPKLLLMPSKKDIGHSVGLTPYQVSRCFRDSAELRELYDRLLDLDAVMGHDRSRGGRSCPSCGDSHDFRCPLPDCPAPNEISCERCHAEKFHDLVAPPD